MIYFNHSSEPAESVRGYHLDLTRRTLAAALDDKRRLAYCLDEARRRIAELEAEADALRCENIRLTGQVHATLATIERAVTA